MKIIVTYDVSTNGEGGPARLRKVAKICEDYGIRVQNSVFECNVDASAFLLLKANLLRVIDIKEDSLRIYNLGNKYQSKIEHYGAKVNFDLQDAIIL